MENNEKLLKELLVVSKEDKLAQLRDLLTKTRDLISLDEETKKVHFDSTNNLSDRDKILLFLIGRYFMRELKWIDNLGATIGEISTALNNKPVTSLTAPLADFRDKGIVLKNGSEYSIPYPEIKGCIEKIHASISLVRNDEEGVKKGVKRPKRKEKMLITLNPEKIISIAKEIKITEEELRTIYQLEQNNIHLIRSVKGETIREQHLNYSLLIAFAYRVFYNIENLDSSELRDKLSDAGCPKLVGLSTSLKEYPTLIIHQRGEKGNIYTTYKITQQGMECAKELIRKMTGEETQK
jgi:hypothetical protein